MFQPALCNYTSSCEVSEKLWQLLRCKNKVLKRGGDRANARRECGAETDGSTGLPGNFWDAHLLEYQFKTRNINKPPTLRTLKLERHKNGLIWGCKNIHNGSLPETLRAVTALFRKLSPDSALHPFGHLKDSTTQITQNSCIKLVDLGIFLSDTVLVSNEQIHWQWKKIVTDTSQVNC